MVSKTWPEFAFHPENENYVLDFTEVNSLSRDRELADEFEIWVEENRQNIAKNAAGALGYVWDKDIEANAENLLKVFEI